MPEILIRKDERVTLVGKTGSGKTFLAHYLLKPIKRLIVLDPKGTLTDPKWKLEEWTAENLRKLGDGENMRMRVPAPISGNWEPYLSAAYTIGNVTVYIDEVYGIVDPGSKPPKMFTALYTRGRELDIGVFAATQRPAWMPLFVLSEPEWIFVFRLTLESDRKKMAEIGGPRLEMPVKDKYGFYVYNTQWEAPEYSRGL